jgi:hypothetical protein
MRHEADTRGFALPTAIGALVIVGVLVTAGFYMAQQEVRIGVATRYSALAVNLAQSGANGVMVNNTSALTALSMWDTTRVVDTLPQGIVSVKATKIAPRIYFLDATATVTAGGALWSGATRRIGLYSRMSAANVDPPGALVTQGQLKIGGSTVVNGNDTIPAGWGSECDSSSITNKPGILINDTTQIQVTGGVLTVFGTPAFSEDSTITSASLLSFGDMTWADMAALAEIVYPTGTSTLNGLAPDSVFVSTPSPGHYRCNTANTNDWGDPLNPGDVCGNYFPIIYSAGSLKITGGYGQGILLVEGDLNVQGGFQFFGPVYVKGTLSTSGTGGHFNGGVVAANFDLSTSTVLGNAVVTYSSCAVQRAILNNSALTKVRPVAIRSWVDLSGVLGS